MSLRVDQIASLAVLLDRLLVVPAAQRPAWVDALQGDEAALAPALHDLLLHPELLAEATGTAHSDWSQPLREAIAGTLAAPDTWHAGAEVGPWRLISPLGEGGMGVVWLAERVDGTLKRQVALKLPRPGLQRWRLGERFARERDILASLDHPHIARLFDAGVTADGQAWLAMEVAAGQPITQYAEKAGLRVRARLALFQQALAAVQHAHQRLVVHRDLKPSNILVDEQGQVRLLDFGIAVLQDNNAPQAALTEVGQPLLTPLYAAPEQVAQQRVSTASDIYALGVVLCELLSGHTPYAPTRPGRAALEEAVLSGELRRPSGLAPAASHHALRGDLDNIVMKALQREPAQRYASADAFAQDITRHLDGLPVLAMPASWAYRARKFATRNRVGVAAGSAVVLALLIGSGLALWQAQRASQQAQLAQQEARKAQAVQAYLVGLFNEADPARAQGRTLAVRDLLARGERELRSGLAGEPAVAEQMTGVLADIHHRLGDDTKALALAQQRMALASQLYGRQSLEFADALASQGQVQAALYQYEAALASMRAALVLIPQQKSTRRATRLDLQVRVASVLNNLRRMQEARELLQQTLPELVALHGAVSWPVTLAQSALAQVFADEDAFAQAAAIDQTLAGLLDRVDPEHQLEAADIRAEMGTRQTKARNFGASTAALQRALQDFDRLLGPDNSSSVSTLEALTVNWINAGDFTHAETAAVDIAARAERVYAATPAQSAYPRSMVVYPFVFRGRAAEAESVARDAVLRLRAAPELPPSHLHAVQRRHAVALIFTGRAAEALALLDDVLAAEAHHKINDHRHALTLFDRAGALNTLGRHAEAATQARAAGDLWLHEAVPEQAAKARLSEALALSALGRADAALASINEAQTLFAQVLPADHVDFLFVAWARAELRRADGHAGEADALQAALRQRVTAISGATLPLRPWLLF